MSDNPTAAERLNELWFDPEWRANIDAKPAVAYAAMRQLIADAEAAARADAQFVERQRCLMIVQAVPALDQYTVDILQQIEDAIRTPAPATEGRDIERLRGERRVSDPSILESIRRTTEVLGTAGAADVRWLIAEIDRLTAPATEGK